MATELVQRLRAAADLQMEWHYWEMQGPAPAPLHARDVAALHREAADRIERLERLDERILQAAESFAKRLAVLETALDYYADEDRFGHQGDVARRALGWRYE